MTRPAVCFGGPSPEHDISILTGLQAAQALVGAGTDTDALYWAKTGDWYQVDPMLEARDFADGLPAKAKRVELVVGPGGGFVAEGKLGRRSALDIDVVVNCCHGGPGEDGALQAAFDLIGLNYTGPSAAGASLGIDKLAFRGVTVAAGIESLPCAVLLPDSPSPDFDGPYIVKPRFGGSSLGIHVVADFDSAQALVTSQPLLRDGALVEPYLADAVDLNISIRTWPQLELSDIERPLRKPSGEMYSYAEKYLGGEGMASAPRELPADLPAEVAERLRSAATTVARIAEVRSLARIDFLWSGEHVYCNEINTIPGSLSWYFWNERGIPFARLLGDLIAEARKGPTRIYRSDGADGTALRAVGNIASKLA